MLNIIAADAWTSDALWAWYCARGALSDAIAELETAGAALGPLVEETQWHAQGVLALHELVIELRARTAAEVGELNGRLFEVDALGAS